MKKTNVQIGHLIRDYRIRKGLTQLDLATKLNYDGPQFVSLIERGLSKTPFEILGKLIIILGIPERKITKILLEAYEIELAKKVGFGKKTALGEN
ncbi:MAG: helix-turn-helix transcriptional regulator [Bdellovibrio sp.]|nr:helix-turn-helix transcriptional regulator [Bdellovibrio sp.]